MVACRYASYVVADLGRIVDFLPLNVVLIEIYVSTLCNYVGLLTRNE